MAKDSKAINAMENDWQVEQDLRTIVQAMEIREDKARYAKVKKLAAEKAAEMKAISAGKTDE